MVWYYQDQWGNYYAQDSNGDYYAYYSSGNHYIYYASGDIYYYDAHDDGLEYYFWYSLQLWQAYECTYWDVIPTFYY
jgi:hypothetical protein